MKKKVTLAAPRDLQGKDALRRLVKRVLEDASCQKGVNVILTDDDNLAGLNRRFLRRRGPTDVLAFPFREKDFLGEVYVSLDRAKNQAQRYKVGLEQEIKRLIVHGLLHLLGYSHNKMQSLMERYL